MIFLFSLNKRMRWYLYIEFVRHNHDLKEGVVPISRNDTGASSWADDDDAVGWWVVMGGDDAITAMIVYQWPIYVGWLAWLVVVVAQQHLTDGSMKWIEVNSLTAHT